MHAKGKNEKPPLLERIAAAIGLFLIVSLLAFTLYHAVYDDPSAPAVSTEILSIARLEHGYLVKVKASNNGGTTAAALKISGSIEEEGETREESDFTLDYLPSHSHKEGGLFFTKEPRRDNLLVRAVGYQDP